MADATKKTVATPCDSYDEKLSLWEKCRAICGGEEAAKAHDTLVGIPSNFLIPFSPTMTQVQYNLLKQEAELPGVSAEFARLLVAALLRKEPEVVLPSDAPAGALEWIRGEFGADGSPLVTYMDTILLEEIITSRGWTAVDYYSDTPFPVFHPAESIINWYKDNVELKWVIVAAQELVDADSEFHQSYRPVMVVHELVNGQYQVRRFYFDEKKKDWYQDEKIDQPLLNGKPLDFVPLWPNNGEIEPDQPFLLNIVNKEVALYNKITRRNHLLYGAATYTPYLIGNMDDTEFNKVVAAGLGSWLKIPEGCKLDVLKAPTEALVDLDRAIASGFEELAKLGVRMLTPETAQSGVALQLRNASQTAKVGTLNTRISVIMSQIIATMVNWRYRKDYKPDDVKFSLQNDFTNYIQGEGWLRLATEWYENGHIPRSVWIQLLRQNNILPDDYNDDEAQVAIERNSEKFKSFTDKLKEQQNAPTQ